MGGERRDLVIGYSLRWLNACCWSSMRSGRVRPASCPPARPRGHRAALLRAHSRDHCTRAGAAHSFGGRARGDSAGDPWRSRRLNACCVRLAGAPTARLYVCRQPRSCCPCRGSSVSSSAPATRCRTTRRLGRSAPCRCGGSWMPRVPPRSAAPAVRGGRL